MKGLAKIFKGFETVMTAATFAEEGEFETAREILREKDRSQETIRKTDRKYTKRVAVRDNR